MVSPPLTLCSTASGVFGIAPILIASTQPVLTVCW